MIGTYVVTSPFGTYAEGDVISLPDDVAAALSSYVREATQEDLSQEEGDEEAGEETPVATDVGKSKPIPCIQIKEDKTIKGYMEDLAETVVKKMKLPKPDRKVSFDTDEKAELQPLDRMKEKNDFYRHLFGAKTGRLDSMRYLDSYRQKTTPNTVGVAADGGYTIAEQWTNDIFVKAQEKFSLLEVFMKSPQAHKIVNGNTLHVPMLNDVSRANSGRPLRYYAVSENAPYTQTKMVFGEAKLQLKKFGILAQITQEMLQDRQNIAEFIDNQFAAEIRFMVNDLFVNSVGHPNGLLNSAALVSVSKGSTGSKALLLPNLANMYARLWAGARDDAIFIGNQQVETQLIQLLINSGTSAGSAYGLTFDVRDSAVPLSIFSKPYYNCETCAALGNVGDCILFSPSQFAFGYGDLSIASSDQVDFLNGTIYYRAFWRIDLVDLWSNTMTAYTSPDSLGPVVTTSSRGST